MAYEATTRVTHSENIRTGKNLDVDGAANVGTLKVAGVSVGAGLGSQVTFTQTYSTSDATVAALTYSAPAAITAAALTVTDGEGTNDGTIGAITDNASTIAAVQELAAQISKLVTDITSIRTQLVALAADVLADKKNANKLIDVLQANGWAL